MTKEPHFRTQKLWELILLLILGSVVLQYALHIFLALLPVIIGILVVCAVAGALYRRARRW